jgi:hypothetical protein
VIRRWEMAFWALMSGTVVGCMSAPLYGVPMADWTCDCQIPCGEGPRDWTTTRQYFQSAYPSQELIDGAVDECNTAAAAECDITALDECTCYCEED